MNRSKTAILVGVTATMALILAAALPLRGSLAAETVHSPAAFAVAPVEHGEAAVTYNVASEGNSANYRVREQLVGFDLPNDAVGVTEDVTGSISFDESGKVVPGTSRIVVKLDSLKSDQSRRDGYVRSRVLETEKFPSVEFAITGIRGLDATLPTTGTRELTLDGNLTLRGVTRPASWTANATFNGDIVSGNAATSFTFADFELMQPRVRVVLSVADTIRLEYAFRLERAK